MRLCILVMVMCLCRFAAADSSRNQAQLNRVWTYATAKGENVVHDMCVERLKRTLASGRWQLQIITEHSIRSYLPDYDHYHAGLTATKVSNIQQQMLQLVKLQVLYNYGGLWVDPNVIMVGGLEWVGRLGELVEVDTFGQESYQLVLFSTTGRSISRSLKTNQDQSRQLADGSQFKSTAIMLAQKDSKILEDWIGHIKIKLKAQASPKQRQQQRSNTLKQISLETLNSLLVPKDLYGEMQTVTDALVRYKVWHFTYLDYYPLFAQYASSSDANVVVDYYIKEDMQAVTQAFGYPQYFISLAEVDQSLDVILNPSVSSLQFISSVPYVEMLWPREEWKMDCIHYVLNGSLLHTYLIGVSTLREAKLIRIYGADIISKCNQKQWEYFWNELCTKIGLIIILIILLLALKLELIVVCVAYRSVTAKISTQLTVLYESVARMQLQPV